MQNGQKPQEMKPEDFILEANQKASGRTAFVGQVAERLFHERYPALAADPNTTMEAIRAVMVDCIQTAELWRQEINAYQHDQAKAIHNEQVNQAKGAGLVLPTWGQIKDHFPGGFLPGVPHG